MSRTITDNNGIFGKSVLRIDDDGTIREPYFDGNILGRIDKDGTIYKVTEYGMLPVGHLSEDGKIYEHHMFGNDYKGSIKNGSLRDRYGYGTDSIGLLKDKKEEVKSSPKTKTDPAPSDGSGSGAVALAIIVAIALVYFFRATIPLHLHNMFVWGETEFFFLTIPVLILLALFIFGLFQGHYRSATSSGTAGFLVSAFALGYMGIVIYAVTDFIVMAIACIMDKGSFWEWLVASISMIIMYAPTFIVILVPGIIIGAIIISSFSRR